MKYKTYLGVLIFVFCSLVFNVSFGQGPPITGDKPLMLGAKRTVFKSLTEIRKTERGNYTAVPLMVHYLPSSKFLVGAHIPFIRYNNQANEKGNTLGDIQLLFKYQFYKKDKVGKTFRMVAKTLQTIPTGKDIKFEGWSTQNYQSYLGIVAGLETIKYGISNELAYNFQTKEGKNELRYKLGFGLPLLKPRYPVNQLNLYFEYQSSWFPTIDEYQLFYAQGIQYAKGRFTWEASFQLPLIQDIQQISKRTYSLFLGTRFVL